MSQTLTTRSSPTRSSAVNRQHVRAAYLFITPFVVIFLALFLLPLGYAGYLSLFRSRLVGGDLFVGLENYAQALTDPNFLGGLGRVGLFLIIQVPIMLGLALFFALALDSNLVRGAKVARLAIFVPYAVPGVVAALMWGFLYGGDFGPIAQAFKAIGWQAPDLLSADNMLGSIMNIVSWEFIGYNMIIMYAALRTIPTELFDAAEVDGATAFRVAWSIKIPAIRGAIMLTVIFSIIGAFQLFNEPNLLYLLAPNVIGTAFTPNLYAYNVAFIQQNTGYAAAIAFLLGIVIMIVSYVVQLTANRGVRS